MKPVARIYAAAKTAMQSGRAKTGAWILEYEPARPRRIDPLTGWTSSADMRSQIRMRFTTREQAEAYARGQGLTFRVEEVEAGQGVARRSYADNFRPDRRRLWTH